MKKALAILMAAAFALLPCYGVFGEDAGEADNTNIVVKRGIVKEVVPFFDKNDKIVEGSSFIWLQLSDDEEDVVVFQVSEQTKILNNLKISAGAELEAGYDANLPVIMIYPPRYNAVTIEVIKEGSDLPEEDAGSSEISIFVNGERVMGAYAYEENGVLMVPLRAVSEQLMYPVTWDGELKQIKVGDFISLSIGKDEYIFARMAPFNLGTAPIIKDGITYVPLNFFSDVMRFGCDRVPNGHIAIDSTVNG